MRGWIGERWLFVAALGCLTTVLFGLAPALARVGGDAGQMRPRSATGSHTAHAGMARPLVAAQIGVQPDDPVRRRTAAALVRPAAAGRPRVHTRASGAAVGRSARSPRTGAGTRRRPSAARARRRRCPASRARACRAGRSSGAGRGATTSSSPAAAARNRFRLAVSPAVLPDDGHAPSRRPRIRATRHAMPTNPMPVIVNEAFARTYLPGRARGRPAPDHDEPWPGRCRTTSSASSANARDGSVRGEISPVHVLADRRCRGHAGDPIVARSAGTLADRRARGTAAGASLAPAGGRHAANVARRQHAAARASPGGAVRILRGARSRARRGRASTASRV